jgi:hypothetical protein
MVHGNSSKNGYITDNNTLIKSSEVHGMYNPGSSYYWLASPSAYSSIRVMNVSGYYGNVYRHQYYNEYSFCPLVSLKSDVTLTLASE